MKKATIRTISAIVLAVVTTWLLGACATNKHNLPTSPRLNIYGDAQPADPDLKLSLSDRLRFDNLMMAANTQRILGQSTAYYDLLDHSLRINPDAPEALYQMGLLKSYLNHVGVLNDTTGLAMMQRAAMLDPKNSIYLQSLVNSYLRQDSMELAQVALEQLAELTPRNTDVLGTLMQIYEYGEKYDKAIDVLNRLEVIHGKTTAISRHKYDNYHELGRIEEAQAEMEALCREFPNDPAPRLMYANLLTQDERYDEAMQMYSKVQTMDPNTQGLRSSLLLFYKQTGADSLYRSLRDEMIYSPTSETAERFDAVTKLIDDVADEPQSDSMVMAMFDSLEVLMPDELEVLRIKGSYLTNKNSNNKTLSPELVQVIERINELDPTNKELLFTLIQHYAEQQQYDRMENICRTGVINFPEELVCHFYLGVACYQQEHKADALKAFQDGVQHRTADSNPAIVAELFGVMGDVLHDLGHPNTETFAAYDSSLVYNPDNASYLNNYAYYLSLDNSMLDRAEDMSYRSLRIEPNNKTYLDTYAWILFMQKRYDEAQEYIDRVCPPDSTDEVLLSDKLVSGVVLEHAGDIAIMNGKTEQALRFWHLAEQAGGSGITATLQRKIRQKKYIKP